MSSHCPATALKYCRVSSMCVLLLERSSLHARTLAFFPGGEIIAPEVEHAMVRDPSRPRLEHLPDAECLSPDRDRSNFRCGERCERRGRARGAAWWHPRQPAHPAEH